MSEQFKREDRYIVFKKSDIKRLVGAEETLERLLASRDCMDICRRNAGKQPLECLVIESDWPEYEPVWKMIEERMSGRPAPTFEGGHATAVEDFYAAEATRMRFFSMNHFDFAWWGDGDEAGKGGWRYRTPNGALTDHKELRDCIDEAMEIARAEELIGRIV